MKNQPDGGQLPVVVQLGFAGSRHLFNSQAHPDVDAERFHSAVEVFLTDRLKRRQAELGLKPWQFLCGISSAAIGGDTVFSRACRALQIPQRVFLPQERIAYLDAEGGNERPDFAPAEKDVARELLSSPHVIQERVVSDSFDRRTRFEDVNLEIVRVSDALVCLLGEEPGGKPGGTNDLIQQARTRGRAVLEIRVSVKDGQPQFAETWHSRESFRLPELPRVLASAGPSAVVQVPSTSSVADYCQTLKDFGSRQAAWQQKLFNALAAVIIGTHVLATILAVIALTIHGLGVIPWLLGFEMVLLAGGLGMHHYLHWSQARQVWAVSRLVAEVARSVTAVGPLHVYLEYLFTLPFPPELRPLLRTISVLHLRSTRGDSTPWQKTRDSYVDRRLTSETGQIPYYRDAGATAEKWLRILHRAFVVCSVTAFVATFLKVLVIFHAIPVAHAYEGTASSILGGLAIVMPVLAVAALSIAAALDLEARKHTYKEMLEFLEQQVKFLHDASFQREFARLLLETEARLLGEITTWFSRRSFTGVA
jgi:hypothetical protein